MQHRFRQLATIILATFFMSICFAATEPVWIDVRTAEEHAEDNIPGDIHIDVKNIHHEISKVVTDKNTPIMLYCRSGRRAEMALQHLKQMGYTNVTNVGGIEDARNIKQKALSSAASGNSTTPMATEKSCPQGECQKLPATPP